MIELVDIPGMSPILRISSLGTCNQKNTKADLRDPYRVLKIGPPKIWVGDQFGMVGGPLKKKNYPVHRAHIQCLDEIWVWVVGYIGKNECLTGSMWCCMQK